MTIIIWSSIQLNQIPVTLDIISTGNIYLYAKFDSYRSFSIVWIIWHFMWYICKWRVAFFSHIYEHESMIVLINLNYYMRNDFSQWEGNVKRVTSPAKTVLIFACFVYSCLKDNRHSTLHLLFTKSWLHPVYSKLLICRIESFANCLMILCYHSIAPQQIM